MTKKKEKMPAELRDMPGETFEENSLAPPLVEPIAVDDVEMYEIFTRYNLQPLLPPAKFEYQLVELIAALEKRVRELDPEA